MIKDALVALLDNFSEKHARILMLGLDNAGKTTVLYKLKFNESITTVPTLGFNMETVQVGRNIRFTVWDVGGQVILRSLWKHYYAGSAGLVYVVDASDRDRFSDAKEELHNVLASEEMKAVPVLVLANKQDLPQAATPSEVADCLGLPKFVGRQWHVQGTSATIGEGVLEGMQELCGLVKQFQSQNKM